MCVYITLKYIIFQNNKYKKRKQINEKTDRQPERETDESQLIGQRSWFYGPSDSPSDWSAPLVWGADVTQTASY